MEIFAWIDRQRGSFPLTRICALYGVSRVGDYAWRRRGESARREQDRGLLSTIRAVFDTSRGTYGSPRIHQALRAGGTRVSRRGVARLMREAGLRARAVKLYRAIPGLHAFFTSIRNRQLDQAAPGPDQVWVGDITYLKVGATWRYLAVVMDRYSRRIIGWSLGRHKDARLTLAALTHAVVNRRPRRGLIFHSDRGIEYAAYAFRRRLATLGFIQSMNRPREITDNAHMESFFHSMKTDVLHGAALLTADGVGPLLHRYFPYYNRVRLHSGLGYRSPVD
jgi:transposase InsO family protein